MSHPFVGIYFVHKGTNITSFEMVRAKQLYVKNILRFFIPSLHFREYRRYK